MRNPHGGTNPSSSAGTAMDAAGECESPMRAPKHVKNNSSIRSATPPRHPKNNVSSVHAPGNKASHLSGPGSSAAISGGVPAIPLRRVPTGGSVSSVRSAAASTASSSASRELLRKDILKRRKSLTIREQNFLELLIIEGDDNHIEMARRKLNDRDLFFDSSEGSDGEEEEEEEGDARAVAAAAIDAALRSSTLSNADDDEEEMAAAATARGEVTYTDNSLPLTKETIGLLPGPPPGFKRGERSASVGTRASDSNIEVVEDSDGEVTFHRHVSTHPSQATVKTASDLGVTPAVQTKRRSISVGSSRREEFLQLRRKSSLHDGMWRAHERGIGITRRNSEAPYLLRRQSSAGSRLGAGGGRRPSHHLPGPLNRTKSTLVREHSFLSTSTAELVTDGGPSFRPGEDEIFRGSDSIASIGYQESSGSGNASIDLGSGLVIGGGNSTGGTRPTSIGHRPRGMSRVSFHGDVDVGPTALRRRSFRLPRRSSRRERNLSGGSTGTDGSLQGYTRSDSEFSFPGIMPAHPVRSESMSSIPPLRHGHPIQSESESGFLGLLQTVESSEEINEARQKAKAAFAAKHHKEKKNDDDEDSSGKENHPKLPSMACVKPFPPPPPAEVTPPRRNFTKRHSSLGPRATLPKPVIVRRASRSTYQGEGMEISEIFDGSDVVGNSPRFSPVPPVENIEHARKYRSLVSAGETLDSRSTAGISINSSFDENMSASVLDRGFIIEGIKKSLSNDDMASLMLGQNDMDSMADIRDTEDTASWDLMSHSEEVNGQYNAWNVLKDDYAVGYGGAGTLPFLILGTSADDEASNPHVLSPPLMESLQAFLPYSISEDNFWMKYSLVRDGASFHTLLQSIRGTNHTIIAVETVDGEVFGSFTSTPWRKNWNFFGSGEAFLWKMRKPRTTPCFSILDQAQLESELDVFPWTGENNYVQFCTSDKIAVGGGYHEDEDEDNTEGKDAEPSSSAKAGKKKDLAFGFGLAIDAELLHGTSARCVTFGSPPLSSEHSDGTSFEIVNLEVWTLTPCTSVEEAEKLELGRLFFEANLE